MKAGTLPLFRLAPIEVTPETVSMAAGKTPPFEGMTPGKPIQVFPMGEARTVDGRKVRCGAEDFALVLGDLATRKNPVTITVEHEMDPLWGSKAAGECPSDAFLAQGDGFWGLDPRWTDAALAEIRAGARRWISPTFYGTWNEDDDTVRPRILRDVSLVSVPNLDGMAPVTASASKTSTPSPSPASDRKEQEMKLSAETLKLLGLADGASQEDVDKAVQRLAAARPELPDVGKAAAEAVEKFRADFEARLKEQFAAEAADRARKERVTALVAKATDEGKVVADNREALEKLAAADPDAFEKALPTLAVIAPTKHWASPVKPAAGEKFSAAQLSDPEARKALDSEAKRLSAEKSISYDEALSRLIAA